MSSEQTDESYNMIEGRWLLAKGIFTRERSMGQAIERILRRIQQAIKSCNWWSRVIINKRSNHWLNKKSSPSNLYFNTVQHQMTSGKKNTAMVTVQRHLFWEGALKSTCGAHGMLSWTCGRSCSDTAELSGSWCLTAALGISNLFARQQRNEAQSGRSLTIAT